MDELKSPPLANKVQSYPLIQSTINPSKIKRNKLYQSNKGMIQRIKAGERKLTSTGEEKGQSSNLFHPVSKTQTMIRAKGRNQQRETWSMCSE